MSEQFIRIRKWTQSKVSMRSDGQSSGQHGEWTVCVCVCVRGYMHVLLFAWRQVSLWNTSTHKHTCMYCTNSHGATPVHTRRLCHAATARQLHGKASGLCTRTCAVVRRRPAPSQESRVLHSSGKIWEEEGQKSLRAVSPGALPPPPPPLLVSFKMQLPEQDATPALPRHPAILDCHPERKAHPIIFQNQTASTETNHRNNKQERSSASTRRSHDVTKTQMLELLSRLLFFFVLFFCRLLSDSAAWGHL